MEGVFSEEMALYEQESRDHNWKTAYQMETNNNNRQLFQITYKRLLLV